MAWHSIIYFQTIFTRWHTEKMVLPAWHTASPGCIPPSHWELMNSIPGWVYITHQQQCYLADWLGSFWVRTSFYTNRIGTMAHRRPLIYNYETACGFILQLVPPYQYTICQMQLGLTSNQESKRSNSYEVLH